MEKKTRRLNKEGSIFKMPNRNLLRGKIWIKYPNGIRKREIVYGKTRTEVKDKMKRLRELSEKGIVNTKETMSEYLNRWFPDDSKSPNTITNRLANIKRIIPVIGGVEVQEITAHHVQLVLDTLREKGKGEHTVRQCRDVLRKALNDAVKSGMLETNPTPNLIKPPEPPSPNKNTLSEYETTLLLSLEDKYTIFWETILYAGLRPGELTGLRWSNVDFESEFIHVVEQAYRHNGEYVTSAPKWGSVRAVPMQRELKVALKNHYDNQDPRLRINDLVFPNELGGYVNYSRIRIGLRTSLKKLSISHRTPDNLRETFATTMQEKGLPNTAVSQMMGHTTTETTEKNYIKHRDEWLREQVSNLN